MHRYRRLLAASHPGIDFNAVAAGIRGHSPSGQRDDERRRATHHAHLLALRAFSAPVEYPAVLATAEAISSGKAAP